MSTFSWGYLWGGPGIMLLKGFGYTVVLTFCAGALAVVIGLITGGLSWLKIRIVWPFIRGYVSFVRNTPFVVQLFFIYFSAPTLLPVELIKFLQEVGFEFVVATIALGVYHGAFFCEVFRAGLRGVPDGQLSGGRALGLSTLYCVLHILLPQAIRISLPALINEGVGLAKNTSIAVAIGVTELTYRYQYLSNFDFRGVEALVGATILYIVLSLTISAIGIAIERNLACKLNLIT